MRRLNLMVLNSALINSSDSSFSDPGLDGGGGVDGFVSGGACAHVDDDPESGGGYAHVDGPGSDGGYAHVDGPGSDGRYGLFDDPGSNEGNGLFDDPGSDGGAGGSWSSIGPGFGGR